jgi:carnosine synthase
MATPFATPMGYDLDFTMIIDQCEEHQKSGHTLSGQFDTDMPLKRAPRDVQADAGRQKKSAFEIEQMLASPGSLPPPFSADQREAAIRTLLPTTTFQMMAKMPRELVTKNSEQGQNLRRKLADGATVVFISAGLPGKRFTFERAAQLGIKVVIIEHPDSWSKCLVDEGLVAKFLPVDMSQSSDKVYEDALNHIRLLGKDGLTGDADGIATFVELSVPLVGRLSEALGLPGHRPASIDLARNKHATRGALKAAGLPTPRNFLIKQDSEVESGGNAVGFPLVLKPVSGAASLGVMRANSMAELRAAYNEVTGELKTLVVSSGALIKGDSNSEGVEAEGKVDLSILLEQYLDGPEFDIDVIMSEGEWRYAAVSDNGPTLEPYFNETWAVSPSIVPKEQQKAVKQLAIDSVKALGFTSGVFHVECKYTSTGPHLIEVNARMGGGQVHECNLRTWGVDMVEETLFAALGIPSRPVLPKEPLTAVAYCYLNAKKSGTVKDVSGLEKLLKRDGIVWAKPLVKSGAKVVGPEEGLPTWICDLLVTRPEPKDALNLLQAIEAECPVKVTP